MTGGQRIIDVRGATQNNLRDVDVQIGPGLTTVVGVSGSGKSSLAFDTVYHEAHRRLLETMALGSPGGRTRPAAVRSIDGLGPAVAIAQNVLNRNPNSTVATAVGVHPFLRILYSRFASVTCPSCGDAVRAVSEEERVREASKLGGSIEVHLVRGVEGSHARLLALLGRHVGRTAIQVDGRPWTGRRLTATRPHDIVVRTGDLPPGARAAQTRAALEVADAFGSYEVVVGGRSFLRAPVCPRCDAWAPPLPATAFRVDAAVDTATHLIGGITIDTLQTMRPSEAIDHLKGAGLPHTAKRLLDELSRRLEPLSELGLDHLALDRPMPTLSRGESQRVRLAVVLAGRLEDLLHVLDEPSIGLHRRDVDRLFGALASLPGPVVMVEHDAAAVAHADDVIEIGPAAGQHGGDIVFHGLPSRLWSADTASGRFFSRRIDAIGADIRQNRPSLDAFVTIEGATARNLRSIDCRFPFGALTAVTGPSGAGKTTLVRDVLLASIKENAPVGCRRIDGAIARAITVDQSPLGNNPRSNAATYTKAFDRIRSLFATASGASPSTFTFNRPEGACPACEGMGAVEVSLRYLASTWIDCEACEGRRYRPEVLAYRASFDGRELTIADALDLSVAQAREVFAGDRPLTRALEALDRVGLGYLSLGQPSPTLSGGEAQRVRLAKELARARAGDLIVLDEPTTGLHPSDLARLISVLDGLTSTGCTVVVVEHQPDVVSASDWVIELGPGGGPAGGEMVHCGPPVPDRDRAPTPRNARRDRRRTSQSIRIRDARANNLRGVDVEIPKNAFTVVTGVSGSGKSSLVHDVLEAEATRRLLECLSMYERQGTREGPEAPVRSVDGLGPTLVLGQGRRVGHPRATVGSASDLDRLLALVLARGGERDCSACGGDMHRVTPAADAPWQCAQCNAEGVPVEPRHLNPQAYGAACLGCSGLGTVKQGIVERLVVDPDKPICGGALHSPGYFPRNYICTEGTGGNTMLRALAAKYGFDPKTTPWSALSPEAKAAFLFGDRQPLTVDRWLTGNAVQAHWRGVMTELSHWDQGGLYTVAHTCGQCGGKRLRPEYLTLKLRRFDRGDLHGMPLGELEEVLAGAPVKDELAQEALATAVHRVAFMGRVGLGYLHLDQLSSSLSAGEAQRIRLASVLGSRLLGMTILLDEPTRGLHPREVSALADALVELRDSGNTVIAVEHDAGVIDRADHVVEIGPGSGEEGGRVVFAGPAGEARGATADALRRTKPTGRVRREPSEWMEITGAREHNLSIDRLRMPLGVLVGVCGVSGSGKSTLAVDTLGLALAPPKLTTSVAMSRYEPGAHDAIVGAPARTVVADQSRSGITSPGVVLGLIPALRRAFAASDDATAAGITESDFTKGCDACAGGYVVERMAFLPTVSHPCDACDGTGYRSETRAVTSRGWTLPDLEAARIGDVAASWSDIPAIGRACDAASRLGLGYLVVRQPGWSLSGGEAQRVKLARELAKRAQKPALHLLDEPTAGLHARDVATLVRALDEVVDAGHSVLVVDHDPTLLACCDWLIELGPGGGPRGGRVIAEGAPATIAEASTPTAPYLAAALA